MKIPARQSAGFTLVELLVAMGILALILATAISARPKTAAARVSVAARAVAAALQLARAQAMTNNTETVFLIDTETGQFGLAKSMHALPRGITIAMTLAETERAGRSGGMRFYPDGGSSGGEIVLMLDAQAFRIAVNWLTGEPRLSR